MTKQEILEGNKLIGEFLGMEFVNDDPENYPNGYYRGSNEACDGISMHIKDWWFHLSWDWIMGVVDKIETIETHKYPEGFQVRIQGLDVVVIDNLNLEWITDNTPQLSTKIECVYQNVIDFIKWYNDGRK